MDCETAKEYLNAPAHRNASELGEAVDLLYGKYGNYSAMAGEVALSPGRLSDLRRVFLLPEGIRWQVDEGKIRIGHAGQISRLEGENQWLLAFTIVEAKMSVKDSKAVVDAVVKKGRPLQDVLHTMIGIRFDEVKALMLPLRFEHRFRIARAGWSRRLDWADFSLKAIDQATRVDLEHIASELLSLAAELGPRAVDPALKPDRAAAFQPQSTK